MMTKTAIGFVTAQFNLIIFAFFLLLLLLTTGGCGKRRPPQPPSRRAAINSLTVKQRGGNVLLTITVPDTLKAITKQISVYRLSQANDGAAFTEEEFLNQATQIQTIEVSRNDSQTLVRADALNNRLTALRLNYAIRLTFNNGQRSGLSNFAALTPFARVPPPPIDLTTVASQNAVTLNWHQPQTAASGEVALTPLGYNVYRATSDQTKSFVEAAPLNTVVVNETTFADTKFEFGTQYRYFVRAVAAAADGTIIESDDSSVASIVPRDVFPPSPPQGLTVAAAARRLSLFFAPNPEADVSGYNVYRSESAEIPFEKWRKLNNALLNGTIYQDLTVEPNRTYYYRVTAVDNAGNESQPSAAGSETSLP